MLSFAFGSARTCSGVTRRTVLRIGGLSLFGLSLPRVLAAEAARGGLQTETPSSPRPPAKVQNCILLWMGGGPANMDTFDLKPEAPREYRGEFRPIDTNVPGIQVCEHLPRMAQQMDKVCVLRSLTHPESGDHAAAAHYMLTGYPQRPDPSGQPVNSTIYPAYGSVVGRELGWRNAMPPYVQITAEAAPYSGAGYMGSAWNPLVIKADPNAADFAVENVAIPDEVGLERSQRRRRMLQALDRWQREVEQGSGPLADRGEFYRQAYELVTSPAAKRAFDLNDEPAALRDRYGRHRLGQSTLLARRLIEAGVRFVAVEFNRWDTHQNNFPSLKKDLLPPLDQCWSALLEDLHARGLLQNTLVVWMGEFGRTPKVNGQGGRDHWARSNVICLSGASIRMGSVVGRTDRLCTEPVGVRHSTHDLAATLYTLLGIDLAKEYRGPDGRPHLINYHGTPIAEALA